MKYFDAFSGYGGFSLGIQRAYELSKVGTESENSTNIKSQPSQYGERPFCVGYSEVDRYAIQVYKKHFPYEECEQCKNKRIEKQISISQNGQEKIGSSGDGHHETDRNMRHGGQPSKECFNNCQCKHKPYGDITKIDPTTLPDFDLLTGGVPCQSWSIAGKRGGFEDERGNMWFQFSRILREKHPKFFLAENVKGLLSHDGGKSMERICEELCGCGYAIDFEVLNAKNFGVPQNRERVFIIGIRLDLLDECQVF